MMLFDSHCHLNYDYAPKTTGDLVREAREAGVQYLMTVGVDVPTLEQIVRISEAHENVFHTVGVHPHEVISMEPGNLERIAEAAKHPKCRAIGEIGLDYHYDHSPREVQIARCEEQLELALKVRLPVVVHSREGEPDLLAMLKNYAGSVAAGDPVGIIHCFTGTQEFGQACIDLGFHVSFSGILTFKNAEDLRTAARLFPMERLLVETDSPYLAPVPFRGKKCEPSMVKHTALKLAELKGLPFDEIARITTRNAKTVFRIP